MKKRSLLICALLISVGMYAQKNSPAVAPSTISFDDNWLLKKDSTINADAANYNDANWRKLDLPHDWSIEDLPNQIPDSIVGPFSKNSIGGGATGYVVGGTGWYRKKFNTEKEEQNKIVTIYFDGVYMNSDVWLNGHHLGNHPYGYTPFYYNLTPFLNPVGRENVLSVRVRNEGKNSRWYSGSGIYRHVWLIITDQLHIAPWGIFITTPKVTADNATINVKTTVNNEYSSQRNITVFNTLFSTAGKATGTSQQNLTIDANTSKEQTQTIQVAHPALWSVDKPILYKAVTEIKEGNKVLDKVETPFGIRSIKIDVANGLTINGKKIILKGGCLHNDNGPLGSVTIDRAEERKIEILKKNGFNAIRTSHNPPSQQFLDACDRLGMLVVDEAFDMWEKGKNPDDYHKYFKEWWNKDLTSMILRDRNHPSVILWSIGNEISERADSSGLATRKMLRQRVRELDSTRMITEGVNPPAYYAQRSPAIFEDLDVGGYNYYWRQYEKDHQQFPNRVMMGTESFAREALENFTQAEQHPYVLGDFVWTAFDYIGEAAVGYDIYDSAKRYHDKLGWPWFNAYCGDFDLTGSKKAPSYYRDVVWRNKSIAMAVHAPIPQGLVENVSPWGWPDEQQSWTWQGAEGKLLQVRVFSRAPIVRLLLNGKLIAEKKIGDDSIIAVFNAPYQPGTLKAVNVVNGKETDAVEFRTAGTPKHIRLVADRTNIHANRNDLSYLMVEVTDDKGEVVPNAKVSIKFSISGAGEIAGVGNGNPRDVSSFQQPEKKVFHGRGLVIIRPKGKPGKIILNAEANGLKGVSIQITTK